MYLLRRWSILAVLGICACSGQDIQASGVAPAIDDEVSLLQTSVNVHKHAPLGPPKSKAMKQLVEEDVASIEELYEAPSPNVSFMGITLDPRTTQVKVYLSMGLVLLLVGATLAIVTNLNDKGPSAYLLAFIACIAFGVDNFVNAYAASYQTVPTAHMAVVFLFDGLIAVFIHFFLIRSHEGYQSEWEDSVKQGTWKPLFFTALTGAFILAAQLSGNMGFSIDQSDSGPHQALVCGDILIVGPFFYYFYSETPTSIQLSGCLLIVFGMVSMSNCFNAPGSHETLAFAWLFLSMVCYAASIITWRLISTGDTEVAWRPRLLLIFGFMGALGIAFMPAYLEHGGFMVYLHKPILLAWPLLNSAASFLGMWSVNMAYQKETATTGAITAVVDANSVALLAMNAAILGMVPSSTQIFAMFTVLVGCVLVCSSEGSVA
jgi:drug/metabolite transporter (DMT)-like permease